MTYSSPRSAAMSSRSALDISRRMSRCVVRTVIVAMLVRIGLALMARTLGDGTAASCMTLWAVPLACGFVTERVTRIELALSAWESVLNLPVRLLAYGCH